MMFDHIYLKKKRKEAAWQPCVQDLVKRAIAVNDARPGQAAVMIGKDGLVLTIPESNSVGYPTLE